MGLMEGLTVLCVVQTVAECRLIPCGSYTEQIYFVEFGETEPPGTDLKFPAEVRDEGDYWQLELTDDISPPALRAFFLSALEFRPSVQGQPLCCRHTAQSDHCNLTLTKTLDLELMRRRFGQVLPPYAIEFRVLCKSEDSVREMETTIHLTVERRNEFPPTFRSSTLTVTFPRADLGAGLVLVNLTGQATDEDVGDDGRIEYSLATATDMAHIVENQVILLKNVTDGDLVQKTLTFSIKATDLGKRPREANMTLVVLAKENAQAGPDGDDGGSDTRAQVFHTSWFFSVGLPSLLVALCIGSGILFICCKKPKKSRDTRKTDRPLEVRQTLKPAASLETRTETSESVTSDTDRQESTVDSVHSSMGSAVDISQRDRGSELSEPTDLGSVGESEADTAS